MLPRPPVFDADTQLCISIASRPGRLGTALHNAGYRALGLNFVYKACGVTDLRGALAGVRALGLRGAGVSMPFKEDVLAHLDDIDDTAQSVGAVNTVVNAAGRLVGYNTDVHGAERALSEVGGIEGRQVLVLGAGGAARAVLAALAGLRPAHVRIAARTPARAEALAAVWGVEPWPWDQRDSSGADLLINATPIGMSPLDAEMPVDTMTLRKACAVMDLVVTPLETRLVREARALGLRVVPGYRMAMHQAAEQFRLYTGHAAPLDVFERTLLDVLQ